MKKICIIFSLAFLPYISFSQSRTLYFYDAAGNRVRREIVMPQQNAMAKSNNTSSGNQMFSDMLQDHAIRIYPNSTTGILKICVSELKDKDVCTYAVYNTTGAQIVRGEISTDEVNIDISNSPIGIYLLKISINDNTTTWKIVKK